MTRAERLECKRAADEARAIYLAKRRELCRKWRAANPDKSHAASKKWRAENPEDYRLSLNMWKFFNRERYLAGQRKWRQENPNYQREYRARRKAQRVAA